MLLNLIFILEFALSWLIFIGWWITLYIKTKSEIIKKGQTLNGTVIRYNTWSVYRRPDMMTIAIVYQIQLPSSLIIMEKKCYLNVKKDSFETIKDLLDQHPTLIVVYLDRERYGVL